MDIRSQTSLIAAVLSCAIAAQVLLKPRRRKVHWLFGFFAVTIAAWYLTTFLGGVTGGTILARVNLVCAVLLPISGSHFFRAFVADEQGPLRLIHRGASIVGVGLIAVSLTPVYDHIVLRSAIFVYVLAMLIASLVLIYGRARAQASRFEAARLNYLATVGGLAATFTAAEYLPYVGVDIPPVGTILILVFLYVLSQSVLRYRLLDLYELVGRLGVLTAVSFTLAAIFWVLVEVTGSRFFLHSVVAALVVLMLFEPARPKVEEKISQIFFRERFDLERTLGDLRRQLAHTLELDSVLRVLCAGLERSRRITHAAVYLVDEDLRGYNLRAQVGPEPVARIEIAPARPLLDRLKRDGAVVLETLEREIAERREHGEEREAETLVEIVQALSAMSGAVCVALLSDSGDVYGFLSVREERLRDAFSPEEVQLLRGLAAQATIAVENSRLYQRMKERDRLAALGEMAAGLAHEIRNPLGAIKASAQFLNDGPSDPEGTKEFLGIIVEEVDRLNRVVASFLDYARPQSGEASVSDVNAVVQRTMQLLGNVCQDADVKATLALEERVPSVRIDAEQLRQVLINLVQNAVQAMENGGTLLIETGSRERVDVYGQTSRWVELRVTDTGPGIPKRVLANLFVPFVTTKDHGTGLGLAISQRMVADAGGRIEVRTHAGVGTTFIVHLPINVEPAIRNLTPRANAVVQGDSSPPSSSGTGGEPSGASSGGEDDGREGAGDRARVVASSR